MSIYDLYQKKENNKGRFENKIKPFKDFPLPLG